MHDRWQTQLPSMIVRGLLTRAYAVAGARVRWKSRLVHMLQFRLRKAELDMLRRLGIRDGSHTTRVRTRFGATANHLRRS